MYQEKLNGYSSFDDRLLFEMEHAASRTIEEMLKWDYDNPHFLEIKYEDLIGDRDLKLFCEIFGFLEFPSASIPALLKIAHDHSLFPGKVERSEHVRSGRPSQWQRYFKAHHKARFIDLFGDCLVQLGYEAGDEWATP